MRVTTTGILVLAILVPCGAADGPRDVSKLLAPIVSAHDVPALAGAVVTVDGLAAIGASGVRERGRPEPVTIDDRWHLGSCTKSMTATLCAILVEEGSLAYDRTVGATWKYDSIDPAWRTVTLRQLLTNRAGAPASLDEGGLWARLWRHPGTPREQRRSLLTGVTSRPPAAPPGSKYIYSNAGFSIAGAIAETVTDEAWEPLIQKRLFAPLSMSSAGFGAPGTEGAIDQPHGHRADGKPVPPGAGADNPAAIAPAGRVHASIGDWAKYVRMHLKGEKDGWEKRLPSSAFVTLHTPVEGDPRYAMGWIVTERPWAGGRVLTHTGSNTMWYCVVWMAPEKGFAVLATCNQGGDRAAAACDAVASALIREHTARAGK